ncbi:MAG: serine hydrolase domain-containing protein [Gaiellaceae bacterium]
MDALGRIEEWPAEHAAAGVATAADVVAEHGDTGHSFGWGSVTKLFVGYATLVAAEEGTVDLDEPAGPPGATVRHLLAHASGLAWDSTVPLGRPGERRIYSNAGIAALAAHLAARAEMPFAEYLEHAVLAPLELGATFDGDAAAGLSGTLGDVLRFGRELLAPTLIAPETLAEATTVEFPGLDGVLPGFGRQTPNDWGLAFELRNGKSPHWTGSLNSPATFGHFGSKPGTATFLWVDPALELACAGLADESFGDWARAAWPALSDAVIREGSPAAGG